jgi:hypothetical protein
MSGMEFIAQMTTALAWPLIVLIAVILLRGPISHVLTTRPVKRLKAGSFELELFEQKLEEAKTAL